MSVESSPAPPLAHCREVDVAIVGAGPAGLAAAVRLRRSGVGRVLVVERESVPGGVPRHSHHTGYGLRDLRRVMTGPRYAATYTSRARTAGAELATNTMVTGWQDGGVLRVTGRAGVGLIRASAVLLATGARERSRTARLIPGDRAAGVYTTGELQQAVYGHGQRIGQRALIVGAEHVSYSAAVTLRHAGVEVVGMITDRPAHQTYAAFSWGARIGLGVAVQPHTRVVGLRGRPRLSEAVLEDVRTGERRLLRCDTVVFTGDWIPDNELARSLGLDIDGGTLGPAVDAAAHTSRPGLFAAGNVCHPVETADVAALGGRAAADSIVRWLSSTRGRVADAAVPITIDDRLQWIHPQRVTDTATRPADGYLVRPRIFRSFPTLTVAQGDRILWRGRRRHLVPNRPTRLPSRWTTRVDVNGPPIRILVE